MNNLKYFLAFWLLFHSIINRKTKNPIKSQNIASLFNSSTIILYFFLLQFIQFSNKTNNILFFLSYYLIDIFYYLWYFFTDADIEVEGEKKKDERKLYCCHHVIAITLLYLSYYHMSDPKFFYYSNIIISLFEISTIFLALEYFLNRKVFFKESFILFRCLILNYFLFKFMFRENFDSIFGREKYITNLFLSILSIGNLLYISH